MATNNPTTVGRWPLLGWAFALTGLAIVEIALLSWVLTALSLATIWVGLPLFTGSALAARSMADRRRLWSGQTMGVIVGRRYRPLPESGWLARFQTVVTDPGTWRDLRWMAVDGTVGITLCVTVVALFCAGVLAIALPVFWPLLPAGSTLDFPLGMQVTTVTEAIAISIPNGLLYLVAWWFATPLLMAGYAKLTSALLGLDSRSQLSERVEELATSRAQAVDQRSSELRRIERDLHDGTQAHLVALGMSLGLAENLLRDNPRASVLVAEAREHNAQAIAELRSLIRGLRPPVLSDRGLPGAVQALAIRMTLNFDIDIEVPCRLSDPIESAAYFSIAEVMSNIVKHANATSATVLGRHAHNRLRVVITDDGQGGATLADGGGLQGIRQRLAAFDGTITLDSPRGGGTTVTIELPCESQAFTSA